MAIFTCGYAGIGIVSFANLDKRYKQFIEGVLVKKTMLTWGTKAGDFKFVVKIDLQIHIHCTYPQVCCYQ